MHAMQWSDAKKRDQKTDFHLRFSFLVNARPQLMCTDVPQHGLMCTTPPVVGLEGKQRDTSFLSCSHSLPRDLSPSPTESFMLPSD